MFWLCDAILVTVLILVVCQAFSMLHRYTFPARRANLPASNCFYLVQNSKHSRKTAQTIAHTLLPRKKRKAPTHNREEPIYSNHSQSHSQTYRLLLHTLSIVVVTATGLILSSLESPQHISTRKLLCCHHGNYYVSRTLNLCSLLPVNMALHKHNSLAHTRAIPDPSITHTYTSSHTLAHSQRRTPYVHCGTLCSTFESDRRTLARSALRVVGICAAYEIGMTACTKATKCICHDIFMRA